MPARKRPAYDATVPRVGKPEWDLAWGIDDVQNRLHSVVHTELKPTAAARERVERNEPCTCGSGKKFKKCCGSPVGVR